MTPMRKPKDAIIPVVRLPGVNAPSFVRGESVCIAYMVRNSPGADVERSRTATPNAKGTIGLSIETSASLTIGEALSTTLTRSGAHLIIERGLRARERTLLPHPHHVYKCSSLLQVISSFTLRLPYILVP